MEDKPPVPEYLGQQILENPVRIDGLKTWNFQELDSVVVSSGLPPESELSAEEFLHFERLRVLKENPEFLAYDRKLRKKVSEGKPADPVKRRREASKAARKSRARNRR